MTDTDYLKSRIREVPDFPKPGILFYDITTLLKDKDGFKGVIDGLKNHYRNAGVDLVIRRIRTLWRLHEEVDGLWALLEAQSVRLAELERSGPANRPALGAFLASTMLTELPDQSLEGVPRIAIVSICCAAALPPLLRLVEARVPRTLQVEV